MQAAGSRFGEELRRRRLVAGWTQAELATRVRFDKSYVSKVETGDKRPTASFARHCDNALGAGGALLALAGSGDAALPRPPVTRWPGRRTGKAGPAAVDSFVCIYISIRELSQRVGPAAAGGVFASHVPVLTSAARHSPARTELLRLAGRFAESAGWMAQELGNTAGALGWFDHAAALAKEGGDRDLEAYVVVRQADFLIDKRDLAPALAMTLSIQDSPCHPRVRGLAAERTARIHALRGELVACRRSLDRASELLAAAESQPLRPVLGSSTVVDPVAMSLGTCLYDAGRPEQAALILTAEIAKVPGTASRTRARYGARLALALATCGEVALACAAAGPVLDAMATVDSATTRTDLRRLHRTLCRWPAEPTVRELLPRVVAALR